MKLYILVNYGPDGTPFVGGYSACNARPQVFRNEKAARARAKREGGLTMVIVGIGNEGEVSEVIDTRTIPAEGN